MVTRRSQRKRSISGSANESTLENEHNKKNEETKQEQELQQPEQEEEEEEEDEELEKPDAPPISLKKSKKKGPKKGVVYIGHPPAFMKPMKVKHLLSQYGEVTNIYLAPEDVGIRKNRKKSGGSSKIKYVEGWVEFADRKIAKGIADALNGKQIGGNRRSFHYEDLWTLKYLPGFQWSNLTERNAYEKRVQKAKLRTEISHARRESEFYLEKVAEEKRIKAIVKNKIERAEKSNLSAEEIEKLTTPKVKRTFKQVMSRDDYRKSQTKDNNNGNSNKKPKKNDEEWLENVF